MMANHQRPKHLNTPRVSTIKILSKFIPLILFAVLQRYLAIVFSESPKPETHSKAIEAGNYLKTKRQSGNPGPRIL